MIRILVFGMTENPGGVESFIISYYRHLNGNGMRFDFLCNDSGTIAYQEELTANGSRIFRVTARSRNPRVYRREMNAFFQEHARDYDVIWVNVCSLANIDYLKLALKSGIPRRIIHSHNSMNMDGRLRGLLHALNRRRIDQYATDFWACSNDAAQWFYREGLMDKVVLVQNAIEVDQFAFSPARRSEIRGFLGCDDGCCLIGNVGRLHFQKNQMFALEVFKQFLNRVPNSRLVLVGQGEDAEKLRQRAKELDIESHVSFAGVQRNISDWLSAMDVFLFPSKFEGLGIAALEAQANGLPVLASGGVIPAEVGLSAYYQTCDLDAPPEDWAEKLEALYGLKRQSSSDMKRLFREKGFDIAEESEKLRELLLK